MQASGISFQGLGHRAAVDEDCLLSSCLFQPLWGLGLLIREAWLAPITLPPMLALLKCALGRALGRKETPHMIPLNPPFLSSSSYTLQLRAQQKCRQKGVYGGQGGPCSSASSGLLHTCLPQVLP